MQLLVCSTVLLIGYSNGANIFVMIPTPLYSHQTAFMELWRKLALRGHNITLVTTEQRIYSGIPNLREISYSKSRGIWDREFSKQKQKHLGHWNIVHVCYRIGDSVIKYQLSQPELQELIHEKDKFHFDLVMIEIFHPELLIFGKLFNASTILLSSLGSTIGTYQSFGNSIHPALNPDMNLPYAGTLTFKERLISTIYQWYQIYFERFIFIPRRQEIYNIFFGGVIDARIDELIGNADMMFTNDNRMLEGQRALGPNIINVRGVNLLQSSKPLSEDLREFLDNAKQGFVYFSLGSNVKSKDLDNDTLVGIMKAFEQIPYKVLWKFESSSLLGSTENVKLLEWAPQQDILRHPNIRAFITQCGIYSVEEAITAQVPMVGMPFFGDQLRNARLIENKKIGRIVNHKPALDFRDLKNAIIEVIEDSRYKTSIVRLANLIGDELMTGLEKAVWWTEYVIRNKGAKELRIPAADIPLYQFYLLDVLGFIFLTAFVFIYVMLKLVMKLRQYFVQMWKKLSNSKFKTS